MLFQVLDVDYIFVGDKPVVRIFGKTEDGETICAFYEGFMPYFYVMGEAVERIVEGEGNFVGLENVKRFLPLGYTGNPVNMKKVILRNPAKTPELRDKFISAGYRVFEADIPFKYRFMADMNIQGMGWLEVVGGNGVNTHVVFTDKKIQASKLVPTDKQGLCDLKYMSLDIECVSSEPGKIPESGKDPIIMISLAFSHPYQGRSDLVLSLRSGDGVKYFEDEKSMLERLIKIIMDYDPDVITGYNINNFDLPYIIDRMKKNNIPPVFGRCDKWVTKNKIGNRYKINISGRIIVDTYEIVKRDFSFRRYDLDTVSYELLGEKKEAVRKSQIEKLWRGNDKEYALLVKYSRKDAVLALKILLERNLLDKYIGLSRVSGFLLQDVLDSGETSRIEHLLLKEFNRKGFVLPCKPNDSEVRRRDAEKQLEGGFVLEPKRGLHSSVIVLDFKSMYPSLIRTYNICPTTIILDEKSSITDAIKTPSGASFVSEKFRKGIVPTILEMLMEERQKVKRLIKKERDKDKVRELSARQLALKIMSNAFYGYFGYTRSKVYCVEIANSITSLGRETIKKTKEYIEKKYGYVVIYGDTDSVMVKVNEDDLEKLKEIGEKIAKDVTSKLPGVMELEFEKIFMRFLPLTKKRYAAHAFEIVGGEWKEKMEMKGIETVRRDWCDLTSETVKRVLEIILKTNDIKKAVEYFKQIAEDVATGRVPIEKLVITKTMTKSADVYAGIQPHAELVKKLRKRNPAEAPGVGDRIGYVIIKGTELLSKRAEDPTYVVEKGLEIDSRYYIENQLLPPLERIFSALNVTKNELLGKGKQISLSSVIMNHSSKPAVLESAKPSEITGLACSRCQRKYVVVPLTGLCECGGELLFSSPNGLVRSVRFM